VFTDLESRHTSWDGLELSAILDRRIRLGIPGILVGRPAPHEEDDASLGLASRPQGRGAFACLKEAWQSQADERQRAGAEELASPYRGCGGEKAVAGGPAHGWPPENFHDCRCPGSLCRLSKTPLPFQQVFQ
jgi:hypothetical protein